MTHLPSPRKLFCFGEGVWVALRGAVNSMLDSGEKKEVESISREEIFFRRNPWYESRRWDESLDESIRWREQAVLSEETTLLPQVLNGYLMNREPEYIPQRN